MDQVLEERVDSATAADRQYVWGERYVDELIVRDRNADASGATGNYGVSGSGLEERLYATNDALYSVTALTNASSTVQERFQYDPYGQAKVLDANFADDGDGVSDVDWEYRFTGRSLDVDTGLDYYRARYYHPTLGRFVGRDPMQADINLYRYVGDNPVVYVDPTGLIYFVIGPFTNTISWIEETKGAPVLLNPSANPQPPENFLGSPAERNPGEDRRSLGSFKSTKEYRNVHELQLTLCCEDGKIVTAGKVLHQHVGYTPIRIPVVGTIYSKGIAGPQTIEETPAPKGKTCYKVTSIQRFRLGWVENVAGKITTRYWAPFAWSRIEYELCCDETAKIKFGGSFVPSHSFYIDFQRVGQHSMANQPNALKRLDNFIKAGDGKDAPGDEKL